MTEDRETVERRSQDENGGADLKSAPPKDLFYAFLLPEDRKEAQRLFNAIPFQDQLEIVLEARGQERLNYLFLSENPEELIQRLPALEVFLTVREVGEKDALDLITHTTPEQFQYLLDLDFWKKDQLDPGKILHWMEVLLECGERKVAQFIHSSDPESIALLLKKFLHVAVLEGEPLEIGDQTSPFTLDQYYFIQFKKKETRPVFQPFLQTLSHVDADLYRRLMEALIVELESDLEETGYRLRNGRLADHGFPDFEEALEIYRFVNPNSLTIERQVSMVKAEGEIEKARPTFYLTFQKEGPFFSTILSKMEGSSEINRLKEEMTSLCNRAMVAESIDLFTMEEMERVTKKVFHTLNVGLQYLSREEEMKAIEILQSLPIQKIFQCGVGATVLLRQKAEALLKGPWFEGDRENLIFLDPPSLERFEGVLKRRPEIYRGGTFQDFRDLQDLKEVETLVESTETIVHLLGGHLKVYPRDLKAMDLSHCYPGGWRKITFSTIFLTSLANQILKRTFQFEAIEKARLKELSSRIFERNEEGKEVIRMEIKDGLKGWLNSMEDAELKRQHLLAFRDFCLDLLEETYGKISPEEEIDPRFVKGLLIRTQ